MSENKLIIKYYDNDGLASIEFETENFNHIIRKMYSVLVNKSDAERIELLKKVINQ